MFPRSASIVSIPPAIALFGEYLADLSALIVAVLLCSSVLVAAVLMVIFKPSPRHRFILDLWAWADKEEANQPIESRLAA